MEALRPLRSEAQRQVVLVTDGEIGFESEIVALILQELPAGCRLNTVGVGLAVARLEAPLLTEVTVTGAALMDQAPARPPMSARPSRSCSRSGSGRKAATCELPAASGGQPWGQTLHVPPLEAEAGNSVLAAVYAREAVEDLEMRRAAAGFDALDNRIERTGLDFQIATRLTSWVAVIEEPAVDPAQPTRRERIPQMVPQGLSVEGLSTTARRVLARLGGAR